MGGDRAPQAIVEGVAFGAARFSEVGILTLRKRSEIKKYLINEEKHHDYPYRRKKSIVMMNSKSDPTEKDCFNGPCCTSSEKRRSGCYIFSRNTGALLAAVCSS